MKDKYKFNISVRSWEYYKYGLFMMGYSFFVIGCFGLVNLYLDFMPSSHYLTGCIHAGLVSIIIWLSMMLIERRFK